MCVVCARAQHVYVHLQVCMSVTVPSKVFICTLYNDSNL